MINQCYKEKSMTEQVFVVPTYALKEITQQNVINALAAGYFYGRGEAETNENLKQIIPYVTITRGDGKVLAYRRSKKGREGRLHNKWSVGFGGHVNPEDLQEAPTDEKAFTYAINRELTEELEWGEELLDGFDVSLKKIIYDNSNAVGRVHLGLNFVLKLEDPKDYPQIGDDEIAEIKWVTKEEALELENLEGWSKIALTEGD